MSKCSPRLIASLVFLAACNRYEWVPDYESPECAGYRRPTHRLLVSRSSDSLGAAAIRGRVIAQHNRQAVSGAQVVLRADSTRGVLTDSAGGFVFDRLRPGTYRLDVGAIGYGYMSDSIAVPSAERVDVEAQIVQSVNDGPCSGFGTVRVKKPWWKFW